MIAFLLFPVLFLMQVTVGHIVFADATPKQATAVQIEASRQLLLNCAYFKENYAVEHAELIKKTNIWVEIVEGDGDATYCGYAYQNPEVIVLYDDAFARGSCNPKMQVLAHEMLHTVGLKHDLSYSDPRYWTHDTVKVIERTCVNQASDEGKPTTWEDLE